MKGKRNKWMKKICAMFLLVITIVGHCGTNFIVNAENVVKTTNQGVVDFQEGNASIYIKGNAGQPLTGKVFYLYRLFDVKNAAGSESVNYTLNEEYETALKTVVGKKVNKTAENVTEYEVIDYIQKLNSYTIEGADVEQTLESSYSDYRYFVEEVLAEIHLEGLSGTEISIVDTKADNAVEIVGLPYGYYMIEDYTETDGEHAAVSMSMLTTANPNSSMNIKADYPSVTKKIQEDDKKELIGLDGWNDIADYEIGQDVPYRYESNIPNMNGYDTYYYAWHDVMDEALTFQPDSVEITISGTVDSENKIYQLAKDEYIVYTDLENETFMIEVADIKAIVDREFDQINERKENIYGQTVTVNYKATLNEKAADNTGRPGFENDVRLEFSNNPNSNGKGETGYTPWDTVVCFTYQMKGIKVNNYGTKLEGAEFRLYYDKECSNEVYVKQISNGYCVMHEDSWNGEIPENAVSMVSDENGNFNIFGLDGGTYYLKEESAPDGYRVISDPIEIKITPAFPQDRNTYIKGDGAEEHVLQLTSTAHFITFTGGESKEEDVILGTNAEEGSFNLSVVNEVGKKLPITGSYVMPVLIGFGILFLCLGMKKGKKKND